jgi:hypothetical protein
MEESQIRKKWLQLLIPFGISLVVLIIAVLFHRLGSKKSVPQAISFLAGLNGVGFSCVFGFRLIKFQRFLSDYRKTK